MHRTRIFDRYADPVRICKEVFDALVAFYNFDTTMKIVVAPIDGEWSTANCMTSMACFRPDNESY